MAKRKLAEAFKKGGSKDNEKPKLDIIPEEPYKKKPLVKTKFTDINDRLEKIVSLIKSFNFQIRKSLLKRTKSNVKTFTPPLPLKRKTIVTGSTNKQ